MKEPSIKPIGYVPGKYSVGWPMWPLWVGVGGVIWYYWDIISGLAMVGLAILGAGGHAKT